MRALLSMLAASASLACGEPRPPDVVLVVIDTLRADALGPYGGDVRASPHLTALAAESVVFEDAVTVAPSTAPAMAALMTGRLPGYHPHMIWTRRISHGMRRFATDPRQAGVPGALETLAERFRDRGYRTVGLVTNGFVARHYGFAQGFEIYEERLGDDGLPYGSTSVVIDRAISLLDEPDDRPLFLYVHLMDPHQPYLPSLEHKRALGIEPLPGLSDARVNRDWLPDGGPRGDVELLARRARRLYDASVRMADAGVGRLVGALEQRGRLDRCVLAVVSDHGEEFYEHGGTSHRGTFYEEMLRVPMLLRAPGVSPARVATPVRHLDLGATLLDYAGLAPQPNADAQSLRPAIEGRPEPRPAIGALPIARMRPPRPYRHFVRDGRYKLIVHAGAPERSELYDLESDPHETRNVYTEKPVLAYELAALAAEHPGGSSTPGAGPHLAVDATTGLSLRNAEGTTQSVDDEGRPVAHAGDAGAIALRLPWLEPPPNGVLLVRVDLEAPADGTLTLRWATVDDPEWRADRALAKPLRVGPNEVEFELRAPDLAGELLLRAELPELSIRSIEVREAGKSGARRALSGGVPPGRGPDSQVEEQLRALGYAD